jgi:hypothetical protein
MIAIPTLLILVQSQVRFHFPVGLSSLTIVIDDESSDAEPDVHQKLDAKNLVPSESSHTLTSGDDSTSGSGSDSDGGKTSKVTPKQVVKKIKKPESSSEESSSSESDSTSSSVNEKGAKMSVSLAPVKHTTDESEESSSEESSDSESDSASSMEDEEEAKVGLSSASSGPIIIPTLGSPEKNYEGQGK